MSSSLPHATITYTSISSDDDLPSWGIPLMDAYKFDPKAPEAAPQSLEQAPLSPVPAPVYPEYVALSNNDLPTEDQPLLVSALPTSLSHDLLENSKPIKDDPEEGFVDYPFEEEEEPLAMTLSASPVLDFVPSSEETKPFEKGETAATPPLPISPHTIVPQSQTRLRRARKTVHPQTPLPSFIEARIAEYAAAPTPPLPPPSPLSRLSSPLHRIPSPPLILPSPTRIDIIPEADMPPRKRV
ncbi:hypothetical protein Tco_1437721 [Tanacetum coccineum]